MQRPLQPPEPPLSDGVVTLRPTDEERDAASLRHFEDPEIERYILGGPARPQNPSEVFERERDWWRLGTNAAFSIDAEGHEERVGFMRLLFGLADPFRFAEVGYFLFASGRGQGYATRAVRLAARWVLDDLGLTRLQARTSLDNPASQRVLERVGFRSEGVARNGHVLPVSGERLDTMMWSLLPGELVD